MLILSSHQNACDHGLGDIRMYLPFFPSKSCCHPRFYDKYVEMQYALERNRPDNMILHSSLDHKQ